MLRTGEENALPFLPRPRSGWGRGTISRSEMAAFAKATACQKSLTCRGEAEGVAGRGAGGRGSSERYAERLNATDDSQPSSTAISTVDTP
jgi:hypothetical protein